MGGILGGHFGGVILGHFGGPKNPDFSDFRWVLNNSPSRDKLKLLFWTFWDILAGHFDGTF